MGYKTQYSKSVIQCLKKHCDDAGIVDVEARKFKPTSCNINFYALAMLTKSLFETFEY